MDGCTGATGIWLNTDLTNLGGKYTKFGIGNNSSLHINFSGNFSAIVSAIGNDGISYGVFFVQGYGIGSARIHLTKIQAGAAIACSVMEDRESIIITNSSVAVIISVFMLYGSLPTFTTD